jgi:hypothetical protein
VKRVYRTWYRRNGCHDACTVRGLLRVLPTQPQREDEIPTVIEHGMTPGKLFTTQNDNARHTHEPSVTLPSSDANERSLRCAPRASCRATQAIKY